MDLDYVPQQAISPELDGFLLPVDIVDLKGAVKNATALLAGIRSFSPASCAAALSSTPGVNASLVLDYGVVVAGIPLFHVKGWQPATKEVPAVLRVSYTEAYAYIKRPEGDGPFPFTAAADTMRCNDYTISSPGSIEHFYIQGGQRWQRIELLTPGTLELTFVGFKPVTFNHAPDKMPGYFECSDGQLNEIWKTGARTIQINAIPARSNSNQWHVTPLGTMICSQRVSHYIWGGNWKDYTFQFEGKVMQGGLAFSIRSRGGFGPLFQVYLKGSRIQIDLLYGHFNEEQITLWPTLLESQEVDLDLTEEDWHSWEVTAIGLENYELKIDRVHVASFVQFEGQKNNSAGRLTKIESHDGSPGIGTGAGQVAMFRNISVISSKGELLYASSLKDPSCVSDFAVGTNILPVMYDGAKRDRAVWLGDTITVALSLYYCTNRPEFIDGSIEAILRRQQDSGIIPAYGLAGFPFMDYRPHDEVQEPFHILAGSFTMYVVRLCYEHFIHTGNKNQIKDLYPRLQKLIAMLKERKDKRNLISLTGLWALDSDYYNKARTGATTKNNALYIIALRKMAEIAFYIGDAESRSFYTQEAEKTAKAVNEHLFNTRTGVYDASENDRGIISEDGNALALLADLPSPSVRSSILTNLRCLYTDAGCTSFNPDSEYMETAVVSPIMNSWHAEAALCTPGHFSDALQILRSCWGPMVNPNTPFYTGCHWEFSTPTGRPHMEHFCSLAHPFSSLPVYQLSKFALGIKPISPGWAKFELSPVWGFLDMLTYCKGRVPTPGGVIHANWKRLKGNGLIFEIELMAPLGTVGEICFPESDAGVRPSYLDLKEGNVLRCYGGNSVKSRIAYKMEA